VISIPTRPCKRDRLPSVLFLFLVPALAVRRRLVGGPRRPRVHPVGRSTQCASFALMCSASMAGPCRMPIAVLTPRGTVRRRKKPDAGRATIRRTAQRNGALRGTSLARLAASTVTARTWSTSGSTRCPGTVLVAHRPQATLQRKQSAGRSEQRAELA
jgi:hypothetical protein